MIFQGKQLLPSQRRSTLLQEYNFGKEENHMNEMQAIKCDRKWNPVNGKLMLNVNDASKVRVASFGFILRDDVGVLKMAGGGPLGLLSWVEHSDLHLYQLKDHKLETQ